MGAALCGTPVVCVWLLAGQDTIFGVVGPLNPAWILTGTLRNEGLGLAYLRALPLASVTGVSRELWLATVRRLSKPRMREGGIVPDAVDSGGWREREGCSVDHALLQLTTSRFE